MNPMIDFALFMVCVAALAAAWPFVRNIALLLEQIEDEYIARQLAEARAWEQSREDYNIHKSL